MDSEESLNCSTQQPRRTLKLEICYDGTRFSGWQAQKSQPEVRTIQGELEKAVERVTGKTASLLGSGRTDAGVSALRQVATFRTESSIPAEKFPLALNAYLPPEIRVLTAKDVAPDFHPIADVVRKRYRYLLSDSRPIFPFLKDYVWFVRKKIDVESMKSAATYLLGKQDFATFETTGSPRESTVRTLFDVSITPASFPDFWIAPNLPSPPPTIWSIEVEADGFLYNMVRAIVGTLVLFGEKHVGFNDPAVMRAIIESKNRAAAGPTAPPYGLYMVGVVYP